MSDETKKVEELKAKISELHSTWKETGPPWRLKASDAGTSEDIRRFIAFLKEEAKQTGKVFLEQEMNEFEARLLSNCKNIN